MRWLPTIAGDMHGANALAAEATLSARVDTLDLRALNALTLPLLNEAPVHLSDYAEHGQHDVADLAACRNMRVKHGDERPALGSV